MKKIGLLLVLIVPAMGLLGQVNDTGTNVAVGNHTPLTKLHVVDNANSEVLRIESSTNSSQIKFRATGTGGIDWSLMSTANGASLGGSKFSIYGNAQHRFVLDQNGKIGIGVVDPQSQLHVKTTNTNSEIFRLDGGTRTTSLIDYSDGAYDNAGLQFKKNSTVGQFKFSNNNGDLLTIRSSGKLHISNSNLNSELLLLDGGTRTTSLINYSDGTHDNAGLQFKKNSTVGQFKFSNNNGDLMTIRSNGNVGIGTTSTFGYKLAVNGTIGATEVKVENTSAWPDFVFENDYKLRTLEEVEQHIDENGHLPEIPSEGEVTENGINLGEMNAKLLQKIEELTLYMIDMNKRMKQIETENTELKEKVHSLENE